MALPKICAVYAILNIITGETYVGSSYDLRVRLRHHNNSLIRGDHGNKRIRQAAIEHGIEAFTFVVLEECLPAQRFEAETTWFRYLEPEYNFATQDARTVKGIKRSEETRALVSAAMQGNKRTVGKSLGNQNWRLRRSRNQDRVRSTQV